MDIPPAILWTFYSAIDNAGGQRVAVRKDGELSYLLGDPYRVLRDHLGSASVVADVDGGLLSETLYKPWGETRYSGGAVMPTDRLYTGQIAEPILGLYFYNARWYDSSLSRFAQADTIIPNPGDPQSWDRYAYVRNSPTGRIDPTGHMDDGGDGGCDNPQKCKQNYLNGKATIILHQLGGRNDLEAMAQIVEYGAYLYGDFKQMIPALTKVFNGVNISGPGSLIAGALADGCAGIGREPHDCENATVYFGDSGFHPDFQDGHNQPFHVWGFIAQTTSLGDPVAAELGYELAILGNNFHDVGQSDIAFLADNLGISTEVGWGTSWNDYVLSEAGIEIGMLITQGTIAPSELADVLRTRLGPSGPGSNGRYNQFMDNKGPLYGQMME